MFLHSNKTNIFKKICLTLFSILFKLSIDIFQPKTLKTLMLKSHSAQHHLTFVHNHRYALIPFYNDINYCKSIKRFLLSNFHYEFHFYVYSVHTEYDSG